MKKPNALPDYQFRSSVGTAAIDNDDFFISFHILKRLKRCGNLELLVQRGNDDAYQHVIRRP
jgi:hypothetical protein